MQIALAWLAIFLLVYCFMAQIITLVLTRRVIAALKSNNAITFHHEIPIEKFGSYGKYLRWLKTNTQKIPAELHKSVKIIKRMEQSSWLSVAITFAIYIGYNLTN